MDKKYFPFRQNNSGGYYKLDGEVGLGHYVIVKANNVSEANDYMDELGFFSLSYCECCGTRFWGCWEDDGFNTPSAYYENDGKEEFDTWDVFVHDAELKTFERYNPDKEYSEDVTE